MYVMGAWEEAERAGAGNGPKLGSRLWKTLQGSAKAWGYEGEVRVWAVLPSSKPEQLSQVCINSLLGNLCGRELCVRASWGHGFSSHTIQFHPGGWH